MPALRDPRFCPCPYAGQRARCPLCGHPHGTPKAAGRPAGRPETPADMFTEGERQGKCVPCQIRLIWRGRLRLKEAACPRCSAPLQRTTVYSAYPVVRQAPVPRPR